MTKYVAERNRNNCCSGNLIPVTGLLLAVIALLISSALLAMYLNGGQASVSIENLNQSMIDNHRNLLEKYDALQMRINRMQKELQFLVSRQQVVEAREASEKRRLAFQPPIGQSDPGTDRSGDIPDPDLPILPQKSDWTPDEPIDVDKLPKASPNKKRGNKI